jgi:hypothetical protein
MCIWTDWSGQINPILDHSKNFAKPPGILTASIDSFIDGLIDWLILEEAPTYSTRTKPNPVLHPANSHAAELLVLTITSSIVVPTAR